MNRVPIFILAILLIGCSNEKLIETHADQVFFNLESKSSSPLSNVFSKLEYQQLNLPYNVFIQVINKVVRHNEKLYILDNFKAKEIYAIDSEGDFLFQISAQGQGPQEYLSPIDILVNDEYIEVLDVKNRILYFDHQGEFIKDLKIPFNASQFVKVKNEYFFYTKESHSTYGDNLNCLLVKYVPENEKIECLIPKPEVKYIIASEFKVLQQFENEIHFSRKFSDTIYSFIDGNLESKYILNFGDEKLQKETLDPTRNKLMDVINTLNNTQKAYHNSELFVNKEYVITEYRHGKTYNLVFNKTKESINTIAFKEKNDIDNGLPFLGLDYLTRDYGAKLFQPDFLIDHFSKLSEEEKKGTFGEFVQNLEPEGSMVLIKYFLK